MCIMIVTHDSMKSSLWSTKAYAISVRCDLPVTHKSTTNSIYTALQVYEDAFDDFTIAMKAKNMVDAMQRFSGQEAELFSLCKYISRLTNESDQLEKEKELLRLNCDKCAKEEVHMFSQQKIIAKELEVH